MAFQTAGQIAEYDYICLSSDSKLSSGIRAGVRCLETDTGKKYVLGTDGTWYQYAGAGGYGSGAGWSSALTITRPANTTPYGAGDVVGGALDFGVVGPSGGRLLITDARLEYDVSALPSGMTSMTLNLYNVTPPSAIADNGAWDLPSGDRASFLGNIVIPTMSDVGSTLIVDVPGVNKSVKLLGTHLFGYLVTQAGFTPAGNSEVLVCTLHGVVE